MTARHLAAALASAFALAACGGGGGGGASAPAPPAIPIATAAPTVAPQDRASIPMTLSFPRKTSSATARGARFLSPGAAAMAIYDGSTLVYVANLALDSTPPFQTVYSKSGNTTVTFGTCSFTSAKATCSLSLTTTIGAHKFDVVVYGQSQGLGPTAVRRSTRDVGTPPVFTGVISSEGELSVTLSPGVNPAATLIVLGVASQVLYAGLSEAAFNDVTTYGYRIQDSTNAQIVQPGDFDNGPVTLTAAPTGVVTITPNSFTTPPASTGDQNFDVACVNPAGGTVTISFNTRTSPNTAYASGLTYSTSNYSGATIATISFTCDPEPATIPIVVQGKKRT